MAIAFRGSVAAGANNGNNVSLALSTISGITTGDRVVIVSGAGPNRAGNEGRIGNALGFTEIIDQSVSNVIRARAAHKSYNSATDGTCTVEGSGNTADGTAAVAFAFSGVDSTTPIDVTSTTATGSGVGQPNPPSITPTSANCAILAAGVSSLIDATKGTLANYTQPTPFSANGNDTNDADVAISYRLLSGGAGSPEDPPAYASWGTGSWVAATIALRPQAGTTHNGSMLASASGTMATTATKFKAANTLFSASGAMASVAAKTSARSTTFAATATMATVATATRNRATLFSASGTMASVASHIIPRSTVFSASGIMSSVGQKVIARATVFNAAGTMSSAASKIINRSSVFSASGALASAASKIINRTTLFAAQALMITLSFLLKRRTALFSAEGLMASAATLIPGGGVIHNRTSAFACVGAMSSQARKLPPFYTYPIGRGLWNDYGKRASQIRYRGGRF